MSTEEDDDSSSKNLNAVTALAREIPIYQDALQPMAQEAGKALAVVGRAVNVALLPVRGLVWGAEQIETWIADRVTQRLKGVPAEKIVQPDLAIAGPIIEALKFSGHKDELSEMFAALLAGAMNADTQFQSHPIFTEKVKNMSSLDARIFQEISKGAGLATINMIKLTEGITGQAEVANHQCPEFHKIAFDLKLPSDRFAQLVQARVENLDSLALIKASVDGSLTSANDQKRYEYLTQKWDFVRQFDQYAKPGEFSFKAEPSFVMVTALGRQFSTIIKKQ